MTSCFMTAGEKLYRGQRLVALNGDYSLVHQYDGDVVIYKAAGAETPWSTVTWGKTTTHLILETNGDFVLYNNDQVVWKLDYSTLKNKQSSDKCESILMEDNGAVTFKTSYGALVGEVGDPEDTETGSFDHSKLLIGGVLPIGGSIFTHGRGGVMNFTSQGGIQFTNSDGKVKDLGISGGKFLAMQDDGNLNFYATAHDPIYSFNTFGYASKGAKGVLILKNGNLVLINDVNATPEDSEKYTMKVLFDFDKF